MKNIFLFVATVLVFICCQSNPKVITAHIDIADSTSIANIKDSFFPVTTFLKGQMILLDSIPVTPLYTKTISNKTDSIWVKKDSVKKLLSPFLSPEIKETNLIHLFKESSFKDETLNLITFTYDPLKALPDSLSLRHWDIYIEPESGDISKVYMVKQMKNGPGSITQQLTWKTGKFATINTFINNPGGESHLIKQEKLLWSFTE